MVERSSCVIAANHSKPSSNSKKSIFSSHGSSWLIKPRISVHFVCRNTFSLSSYKNKVLPSKKASDMICEKGRRSNSISSFIELHNSIRSKSLFLSTYREINLFKIAAVSSAPYSFSNFIKILFHCNNRTLQKIITYAFPALKHII